MRMNKGSVLSPFLFTVVVDNIMKFSREVVFSQVLHADDIVLLLWIT